MFESLNDAAAALEALFDRPQLDIVVEALVPAIVFAPLPDSVRKTGGSRLGGTPDMAPGSVWPSPTPPEDPAEIADRGRGETLRQHLAADLPFAFIAQLDLKDAAALGDIAADLPDAGRLLFFADLPVLPWEAGSRPVRVVYDQSAESDLAPLPMHAELSEAAAAERAEMAKIQERFGRARPPETAGTHFAAVGREIKLRKVFKLPDPASLEIAAIPDLQVRSQSPATDDFRDDYEEAIELFQEGFDSRRSGKRQQLLGSPQPEQDDPRYDAVVVSTFGKQDLSSQEWQANKAMIKERAVEWRLLFQLDLADWMQADLIEGTIFFLIRQDDLTRHDFDRVVGVYQQT
ncbi:DUF1963 domain-containing protein [Jiella mangrovi]|uniref:DUF1963 domain-containing protein n=1 Tax=Jiella mangrovi TaxID=2821407 RepID=A0ABS4BMA7_9HYPH|nr:DUF1963 domain-containing protein [Jiella mangrovi]MBP0617858.1 DUF1963 domain-containing protein [Jiella mangrovi]